MVFLPRTDLEAQERCRCIVEEEILSFGHFIYGWRQVPVDISALGQKAIATRPEIEQIMFSMPIDMSEKEAERQLYLVRRRIEKAVIKDLISDFYICSLSTRSIIYKGMFLAEQVTAFFPDLLDPRFVSSFAIYHQRYSTNTKPTWRLAQPFRVLAHNGEINTIRGNQNWMSCHEDRMESALFGSQIEDLKPVVAKGSSDSAALDAVFELLLRSGRDLPMVKTMMIPEAIDVIGLAKAVVTHDSGLMHVAAATGRPLVALFGPSSPAHTPPLSEMAVTLTHPVPCHPCFERECPLKHQACLSELSVDEVFDALSQQIQRIA